MSWLGGRERRRVDPRGAGGGAGDARATPPDGGGAGPRLDEETVLIDLRAGDDTEADAERAAALAERFRERAARAEAQRDLERLRARHWSGERLIEEGRTELEWWEHPEADPYAVLGLLPGAPLSAASAARRRIAHDCHPDRAALSDGDPEIGLRRMVAANAAYDRLRRALHAI